MSIFSKKVERADKAAHVTRLKHDQAMFGLYQAMAALRDYNTLDTIHRALFKEEAPDDITVEGLIAKILVSCATCQEADAAADAVMTQPQCGHPVSAVVTDGDLGGPGTSYCRMCVEEAGR